MVQLLTIDSSSAEVLQVRVRCCILDISKLDAEYRTYLRVAPVVVSLV